MILFFIIFAVGTLFWGPLSDKYGRKPILLIGLIIFSLASIGCAVSVNIYQLIFFRIIQAIGSGAPTAVATASFDTANMITVLGIIYIIIGITGGRRYIMARQGLRGAQSASSLRRCRLSPSTKKASVTIAGSIRR